MIEVVENGKRKNKKNLYFGKEMGEKRAEKEKVKVGELVQ